MKKQFITAVFTLVTIAAFSASAIELGQARSTGMVGEKLDGYVSALSPSPEVNTLVSTVNSKRREEYTRISKANGQSVDVVSKLAAPQIISGLPSGAKYQGADGSWKTK